MGTRTTFAAPAHTIIDDVTTTPMTLGDLMPAYSFAEGFKYVYLIFLRGLLPVKVPQGRFR